ncbi:MAG TPA: hypothetical protein VNM91_04525 [Dehalococcoidia bacterium]|nr:hypothetical protein [Dehalococcoidia bacterium]
MVALRDDERIYRRRSVQPSRLRVVDEALPLVRRDTLPEHAEYRDTGCDLAPSCLRCPFARCRYDEPPARRSAQHARDREIALLRRKHNAPIDLLAQTYGVSRRQVFRILERAREDGRTGDRGPGTWNPERGTRSAAEG